jgi:hypothetical protein
MARESAKDLPLKPAVFRRGPDVPTCFVPSMCPDVPIGVPTFAGDTADRHGAERTRGLRHFLLPQGFGRHARGAGAGQASYR